MQPRSAPGEIARRGRAVDGLRELSNREREIAAGRSSSLSQPAGVRALSEAKRDAAVSGKEPFDLEALERLCDTSLETGTLPTEERRARLEELYYMGRPKCMTLAELAQYIRDVNKW